MGTLISAYIKTGKGKGGPFLLETVCLLLFFFFFFKAIGSLWFWRKPDISKRKTGERLVSYFRERGLGGEREREEGREG